MRRALPIAAAMVVTVAAVLGWLLLRTSHASGPALTTVSGPGYRVAYPDTWKRQGALHGLPNDVILLVRDPSPRGPLDPGLIIRRTLRDPNLISEDVPALIMADQFRYPGAVVISRSRPPIPGAKDTVEVVTAFTQFGQRYRILDLVARTPANVAYHLQAVGPAKLLDNDRIGKIVRRFAVL